MVQKKLCSVLPPLHKFQSAYIVCSFESSTLSGLFCPSVLVINWSITLCNWTKVFQIYWSKRLCHYLNDHNSFTTAPAFEIPDFQFALCKNILKDYPKNAFKSDICSHQYMMLLAFKLFQSHSYLVKIFYFKEQRFTWGLPFGETSQQHRWRKMSEHHSEEKQNMFSYKTPRKEGYECAFWLLTYIFIMLLDLNFSQAFLLPMQLKRCTEDTSHS